MAKVIINFISGEERTGNVLSFNINHPTFYLQAEMENGKVEKQTVSIDSVKTILFLKKEESGEIPIRTETIDQSTFAGTVAFKLGVEFKDGEVINGTTMRYNPNDKGFFLIPMNPADRSERIFINAQTVKHIDCKKLIGKILADQKKISTQQLNNALAYQKEKREKKIGTILKEEKIISEEQLQESLRKQTEKYKKLGEILVEARYITPEQLEHALRIQQENRKKKLGQILVELKYITPNDICIALATQFQCSWVDLSYVKIQREIATILPEDVVRKFEIIPLEKKGDVLIVATSQPQDQEILLQLNKVISLKVELVVAYEGHIDSAINYFFPSRG
jgi:hypothetical protein